MNLYEFPVKFTKENDFLVEDFELMTAEMTNQGMVRFLTGFLVAKFQMYAESSENYALRETIYKQLPRLEKERLSKKDFIRGVVGIIEKNGHIEKIYDQSDRFEKAEKLDHLDRLVPHQVGSIKQQSVKNENSSMRMVEEEQPEKLINRMNSEEERMAEKRDFEQKMFMKEMTKRKQNKFQSHHDEDLTAIAQKTNYDLQHQKQAHKESMGIAPKRLMEEYIDEKMLQQDDFYYAWQMMAELENQEQNRCAECSKLINLEDIGRLECSHLFHRECLIELIQSSIHLKRPLKECPVLDCRKKIQMNDIKMYIEGEELQQYAELLVLQSWNKVPLHTLVKGEGKGNQKVEEEKKEKKVNQTDQEKKKEIGNKMKPQSSKNHLEKKELKKGAVYKECPKCKQMVEKVSESNEILCNCGVKICLKCGGRWCNQNKCLLDQYSNSRPLRPCIKNKDDPDKKDQQKK